MESKTTTRRDSGTGLVNYVLYWAALITIGVFPVVAGLVMVPYVPYWATTLVVVSSPVLTVAFTFGGLILLHDYEPRSLRQDHW